MPRHALPALLLAALAAGCATLEPEPCTTEWVQWKKDRILGEFAGRHRDTINALKDLRGELEAPGVFTALKLASLAGDIEPLVTDFRDRALPDVRAAIDQCGRQEKAFALLAEWLRSEGVDDRTLAWVQSLGALMDDAG